MGLLIGRRVGLYSNSTASGPSVGAALMSIEPTKASPIRLMRPDQCSQTLPQYHPIAAF